jgi:hypothetical protein
VATFIPLAPDSSGSRGRAGAGPERDRAVIADVTACSTRLCAAVRERSSASGVSICDEPVLTMVDGSVKLVPLELERVSGLVIWWAKAERPLAV